MFVNSEMRERVKEFDPGPGAVSRMPHAEIISVIPHSYLAGAGPEGAIEEAAEAQQSRRINTSEALAQVRLGEPTNLFQKRVEDFQQLELS